jgi:AP-3 complex subunit beta
MAMMTVGRDMSQFFADVVKNVVVENVEVKKLVYMYITHYAEQNADLALLSINTFQKDLQNSNQRVRGNALRAMSGIRVPSTVPLVMIALRNTVKDPSVYVRKAAAHAIPKILNLDPSQREELVELVTILLRAEDPEVLGAALATFTEVCPDKLDMIHPHYRRICHLIADFDEFSQVVALGLLTRYGRTQFLSPLPFEANAGVEGRGGAGAGQGAHKSRGLGSDDEDEDPDAFYAEKKPAAAAAAAAAPAAAATGAPGKGAAPVEEKQYEIVDDHRVLLKAGALLVNSRSSAVVLAVASLFYHLAPRSECRVVAKAMVRHLRNTREIAHVMLCNISTMASTHADMFRPYLSDFFVNVTDPLFIRELKLDVMAKLATDSNISNVLRELLAYTNDPDKRFVTAAIHAIGRVAVLVPAIAERCMRGLIKLVTSTNEVVVAEAVVVMRHLVQKNPQLHRNVVKSMAKLLDRVKNPKARTALVWVVGEYRDMIPQYAPDVLRKLAKSFRDEEEAVRMQTLNLAVKLYLSNPRQTALLFKYVMDLCKFDMSYDIRDRARMLRCLFFKRKPGAEEKEKDAAGGGGGGGSGEVVIDSVELKDALKRALLAEKPSPETEDPFRGRERFTLSSLAHALNHVTNRFEALPEFATVPSDPAVRTPYRFEPRSALGGTGSYFGGGGGGGAGKDGAKGKKHKGKGKGKGKDSSGDSSADGSSSGSEDSGSSGSDSESDTTTSSGTSSGDEDGARTRGKEAATAKGKTAASGKRKGSDADGSSESGSESDSENSSISGSEVSAADGGARDEIEDLDFLDNSAVPFVSSLASKDGASAAPPPPDKQDQAQQLMIQQQVAQLRQERKEQLQANGSDDLLDSFRVEPEAGDDDSDRLSDRDSLGGGGGGGGGVSAGAAAAAAAAARGAGGDDAGAAKRPRTGAAGVLLSSAQGGGLEITYRFARAASVYGDRLHAVELQLTNTRDESLHNVHVPEGSVKIAAGRRFVPFDPIDELAPRGTADVRMHVDFGGSPETVRFDVRTSRGEYACRIAAPIGELWRPLALSVGEFDAQRKRLLSAALDDSGTFKVRAAAGSLPKLEQLVLAALNAQPLPPATAGGSTVLRFAAHRANDKASVLVVQVTHRGADNDEGELDVSVACDDMLSVVPLAELLRKALS